MKTIKHQADFCVIGGGLAGMCAAIQAARHGIKPFPSKNRRVPAAMRSTRSALGSAGWGGWVGPGP